MISIAIQRASFTKDFNAFLGKVHNPVGLLNVAGHELGEQLKRWFVQKERTGANKLSPRRSHFWRAVRASVGNPIQSGYNTVSVTVAHPDFAIKVRGGTITPKVAGALTIPVEERAYNRTAGTFEKETGLKLILLKVGGKKESAFENAVLAVKEAGGLVIEYILTQKAEVQADPTALPPMSILETAILARAQKYVNYDYKLGSKQTGGRR